MAITKLQKSLREHANPEKAAFLKRFFKTEPGGYAAADEFLGLTVPLVRNLIKPHRELELTELKPVIQSPLHEERLAALFILIHQYEQASEDKSKKSIYDFTKTHLTFINHWDLVDTIAPKVIGPHLENNDRAILKKWAEHKSLWIRRIAIVATLHFIRQKDFDSTLLIAKQLLTDTEDLIHKAVGWMLREVGKRNRKIEEDFLNKHYTKMPRTMLRYAIEHFPEAQRQAYLRGLLRKNDE